MGTRWARAHAGYPTRRARTWAHFFYPRAGFISNPKQGRYGTGIFPHPYAIMYPKLSHIFLF
jgi:hypothetical protein